MILCPQSSRSIFTGRFASCIDPGAILAGKNAVGCTECGELHFWDATDAWLEDGQEAPATISVQSSLSG
ncbi:MAG: hypothetical protein WDN01_01095 [Rhizomicrobium sp.]